MKIGILTHQYINNYGAFLQAWALRKAISELFPEDEVQIIDYVNVKHYIINALQADVAEHHGVGVDVEKAPILLRRQRTFPDGLFNRLRLAGALPVVAAVVPTGHVFVACVGVQNVRLLLQLAVIGVKIVAVQIADKIGRASCRERV